MEINCTSCGVAKHFKPSAAGKVNAAIYRCRSCYMAASTARVIACANCGKERRYDGAQFKKFTPRLCMPCYASERKANNTLVTCPRCGLERMLSPTAEKRSSGGYCVGCPTVYDTSIPDTYPAGYIVGVVMGDGWLFDRKSGNSRAYGVRLDVTSKSFALEFKKQFEACRAGSVWVGERTVVRDSLSFLPGMPANYKSRMYRVSVGSREWFEKLKPVKKDRNLDLIRDKGSEFRKGFVQGMIDSEGYVNDKYTDIAGKDAALLDLTREFFESMGHKAKVYGPYPYSRGVRHLRVRKPLHKTR